jgi:hypothetical protein
MTFSELMEDDKEKAFSGWVSVSGAKELGLIPEGFHDYFPDYCECGSENIIKSSRTQIMCCDPRCRVKMGFAIAEMLSRFGVKGLKEASCSKIYGALLAKDKRLKDAGEKGLFETKSYVEVVNIPWEEYPPSISDLSIASDFFVACQSIKKESITFSHLASNLAIPDLSKDAEVLFEGFKSFGEVYDAIKKAGSVSAFCASKGFYAPSVAYNLRHSVIDLAVAYSLFGKSIRCEGMVKFNVCMTGSISLNGQSTTKEKYLKKCNELCIDSNGASLLEIKMTSAKESNPFILYSRESGDLKFVVGQRRDVITDEFGTHPVLMHTDTFYSFLERMVNSWNELRELRGQEGLPEMFWQIVQDSMEETLNPGTSTKTSTTLTTLRSQQEVAETSETTSAMTTF